MRNISGTLAKILLAISIISAAFVYAAMAQSTTAVTGKVTSHLEFVTAPSASLSLGTAGDITPGGTDSSTTYTSPLTVTVKANKNWNLQIQADQNPMKEYASDYGTKVLGHSMTVSTTSTPSGFVNTVSALTIPTSSASNIATPGSSGNKGNGANSGESVGITLSQVTDWEDEPLAEGSLYKCQLTFTLAPVN